MLYLENNSLYEFLGAVSAKENVYVPADGKSGAAYKKYSEGMKVSSALHTTRSAKDFFFPQTESLVNFRISGKKIEIEDPRCESEDFVIFGVRACDVRSFEILDKVFLSEPADTYYKNRREHGTIISMSCRRPSETCFCTAFGIDPAEPAGDIRFTDDGDGFYVESLTEKGRKLLDGIDVFTDKEDGTGEIRDELHALTAKLPLADTVTKLKTFGAGRTKQLFDRTEWTELSESCLGCGTCTFVCPTCQCYDIRDYDTGHGIRRFRCWDSCMYSDFTKMAGGNPRITQKERFRQRFMHKLVYFPDNNEGCYSCVGCGRCLASCPVHMNIIKVIGKFAGGDND